MMARMPRGAMQAWREAMADVQDENGFDSRKDAIGKDLLIKMSDTELDQVLLAAEWLAKQARRSMRVQIAQKPDCGHKPQLDGFCAEISCRRYYGRVMHKRIK